MLLTFVSENRKFPPAMEPANKIIKDLGGEARVAAITGTAYTAPYRWKAAKEKGGTGGTIPQRYHRVLLDYAREHGIGLRAEDFLPLAEDECSGAEQTETVQ